MAASAQAEVLKEQLHGALKKAERKKRELERAKRKAINAAEDKK
jgi:hypothetical protein